MQFNENQENKRRGKKLFKMHIYARLEGHVHITIAMSHKLKKITNTVINKATTTSTRHQAFAFACALVFFLIACGPPGPFWDAVVLWQMERNLNFKCGRGEH